MGTSQSMCDRNPGNVLTDNERSEASVKEIEMLSLAEAQLKSDKELPLRLYCH